jgi:FHA domain
VALVPCESCGGSHPVGTVRCPVYGAILRRPKAPPRPPEDTPARAPSASPQDQVGPSPVGGGPDPFADFVAGGELALRVLSNGLTVRLVPGAPLRLGREDSPIAAVCTDNVSRHHADVVIESDGVVLVDADSTNGTFVNERRLAPRIRQAIVAGDTIRLGSSPPVVLQVIAGPG